MSIRDTIFYADSEVKWKALMEVLHQRGERVGPITAGDYDRRFPYFWYKRGMQRWEAHKKCIPTKEAIKL